MTVFKVPHHRLIYTHRHTDTRTDTHTQAPPDHLHTQTHRHTQDEKINHVVSLDDSPVFYC